MRTIAPLKAPVVKYFTAVYMTRGEAHLLERLLFDLYECAHDDAEAQVIILSLLEKLQPITDWN